MVGRPLHLVALLRARVPPLLLACAVAFLAAIGLAGSAAPTAGAGGPFERMIAVGTDGSWRAIRLAPSGPRGDASLLAGGRQVARGAGGYVRLFPTIGGLPGIPGRYYPGARVLCWSWRQPDRSCWRASPAAVRLLAPVAALPLWTEPPTVLAELRYRGRRVRPALANLLVGLELALERRGVPVKTSVPGSALHFTARWRGPDAAGRPRSFALGPDGVYAGGARYPLERGVWAFAVANGRPGATTAGLTVATQPAALYGIGGPRPVGLVRVEARTLRPRPGRRVPLAGHTFGWSFSPDRARLVLGTDGSAEVRLVDLRRWRVLGDVQVPMAAPGSVLATAWAGATRALAVVVSPGCCGLGDTTVAGIDARRPRLLWQRRLGGSLQAGERFRHSLVLVLGPPGRRLGSSRLVLIGPDGRIRSAPLLEIRSGSQPVGDRQSGRFLLHEWNPGLAVDPSGARAFVVQAGAPVAEVDLRTLRVRYHTLSEPISLLGRLHDWLEPPAMAKAQEGPNREALWLGHGLLAVTGTDTHASVSAGGREAQWDTPAGLKLIDTRNWSARTLDSRATRAVFLSGTLLSFGFVWDSRNQTMSGSGLTGYTIDGSRRFHLYGDDPISGVQPLGKRIIVGGAAGSRIFGRGALLDARTGRELRRVDWNISLLVGDEPFWY